jgi:redox-sensing transcriptional repressor
MRVKIPEVTIGRLSLYLRCLNEMEAEEMTVVSSAELGKRSGINPAQIRKDLAYFGEFGTRGVGYYVSELKKNIKEVMGVNHPYEVALVGVGNLGNSLLRYKGFQRHGFRITAAFDIDLNDKEMPKGCILYHADDMEKVILEKGIKIAIVSVHQSSVQEVIDRLAKTRVKGVLNFAPTKVTVPSGITVRDVDMGTELDILTFYLSLQEK